MSIDVYGLFSSQHKRPLHLLRVVIFYVMHWSGHERLLPLAGPDALTRDCVAAHTLSDVVVHLAVIACPI
jgi:hypothetical protein